MTTRRQIAHSLGTALCEDKDPAGVAPQWVHLLPLGDVKGRDGRTWSLPDPRAIVAAFLDGKVDLPIDFEHQTERDKSSKTGPVPAAGWIKELDVRPNGIWGRVEWTQHAQQLIASKAYRYLSPAFLHTEQGQIAALSGAGLVHHPNLLLTALASQEKPMDTAALKNMIADLLGMDTSATDAELFEALKTRLNAEPDPEKYVPVAALNNLMDDRNAHLIKSTAARIEQKVGQALASGHISPGMKDWATALCAQNEASFDAFIAKAAPQFEHLHGAYNHMSAPPPRAGDDDTAQSELAASICGQLGLSNTALND